MGERLAGVHGGSSRECLATRPSSTAWSSELFNSRCSWRNLFAPDKYKNYRLDGSARYKRMTLATGEFIRRFLIHVLPKGLHRIRHYGLLAKANRAANIAHARGLLGVPSSLNGPDPKPSEADVTDDRTTPHPCPCCGGRMIIIETFARGCQPRCYSTPASQEIRIDTS